MRTGKILGAVVGGIVVLFGAALLAVWLLVNPNAYKGKIAAAVKQATGRDLELPGDIKLSVFPWVALELGPASLGNPPGFSAEPFLAIRHAAVRVRLLPLLAERLEIAKVEIDGLDLRMRKNAEGKGNWEGFGGQNQAPEKPAAHGSSKESLQSLAGIKVTDGRVSYQDLVIDKINIETGSFAEHREIPINISFEADRPIPHEHLSLSAKFHLIADTQPEKMRFAAISLSGLVSGPNDQRGAHWELTSPVIDVDVKKQTVSAPAFAATYRGAQVNGKLEATQFMDDLGIAGSVTLAPLELREFLPRFGIAVPKIRDPRALSQVSASSDFAYDAKGVRLDKMQARLDDTNLKGSLTLSSGEPQALKFEFAVDQIDLNRYLMAAAAPPAPEAKAAASAAAKPADAEKAADAGKPMMMDGSLSIGSVHVSTLALSQVKVTLASKDNVTHLFPLVAQVNGGKYSGDITYDARNPIPALSLDEHLSGVDVGQLLAGAGKQKVSGHGNVNVKATARGAEAEAIEKTMNGHFDLNVADGALEGVDVAYELNLAQSLIARSAGPSMENTRRTKFDAFKMSAEITNGIAKTSDLQISSPVLKVKGQGSLNLPTEGVDFQLLASLLKSPSTTMADIPLKITGTYTDPTVRPDVEALAKGKLQQSLQNAVQDKLKGLFGKP